MAKDRITFPKLLKLLLILLASVNLFPVDLDAKTLSEPARSMRFKVAVKQENSIYNQTVPLLTVKLLHSDTP